MSRIPNNTSTTSKRSLWPAAARDLWAVGAQDCTVTLSNGRTYDDWCMGLGAVTTSYSQFGDALLQYNPCTSFPDRVERDYAEAFCDAMGTEAVRFFKSGSDAVSCAVRLARAATGRDYIIMFNECYHGTASEFKPIAWHRAGYPNQPAVAYPFGDALDGLGLESIAAIVLEPAPKSILEPPAGWLQHVREVCTQHGILLISDEVILGFRHTVPGYMRSIGVRADIRCYGKAMGQGSAIGACTGSASIMDQLVDRVHFSGTNNGEWLPLHIAQLTLKHYQEHGVCEELAVKGEHLQNLLGDAGFETRGLSERFEVVFPSDAARKAATEYCFESGILFPGFCSMATGHTRGQMAGLVEQLAQWGNQL